MEKEKGRVGKRISHHLVDIQMSTYTLHRLIGMSQKRLDAVLVNEGKMEIDEYTLICEALQVSLDEFIIPT